MLPRPLRSTLFPYTTLFRSQRAWLQEDLVRDRYFPNVVDHAAAAQRSALLLGRSEEHTSELQSQSNLVCRLLLEKKNAAYATQSSIRRRLRTASALQSRTPW